MQVIQVGLSQLAYSVVCAVNLEDCHDRTCAANTNSNPPRPRMEALNKIYDAIIKGDDALSSPSLEGIVCENCVKTPEAAYRLWRTTTWENLPRIFGVGRSWEEL